ncbi:hypothetical protein, partial [Streptomyces rimosus]|uniref:hypothetical protein n=1 Tax=Streptomyces rimosus TaxID=1927 RepID=UPI001F470D5B
YQIRSAFPLSVSGSLLERDGRPAFTFRPFRLYQVRFAVRFRAEFDSDFVGGFAFRLVRLYQKRFTDLNRCAFFG